MLEEDSPHRAAGIYAIAVEDLWSEKELDCLRE